MGTEISLVATPIWVDQRLFEVSEHYRGTDQDPVVVGVSLGRQGHLQYALLEAVPNVANKTIIEVLAR